MIPYYLFVIYSVILLVYILAKRIVEDYIFGVTVPLLLIVLPLIIGLLFRDSWAPPFNWMYLISTAVLFLYVLYDKWKKRY